MCASKAEPAGVPNDVQKVSNYLAAMDHGLAWFREGLPISFRLIREIHKRLLCEGTGSTKQPGEFRRSQNWIGGTRPAMCDSCFRSPSVYWV